MPGRTAAFSQGMLGNPSEAVSSLDEQSAVLNEKVAGEMARPHSVLAGLPGMSGNGMSEEDRQRVLPGGYTLPSQNGIGSDSYDAVNRLRMMGGRSPV